MLCSIRFGNLDASYDFNVVPKFGRNFGVCVTTVKVQVFTIVDVGARVILRVNILNMLARRRRNQRVIIGAVGIFNKITQPSFRRRLVFLRRWGGFVGNQRVSPCVPQGNNRPGIKAKITLLTFSDGPTQVGVNNTH